MTIGGAPFISYIGPGQINPHVPTSVGTGAQRLIVTTTAGSSTAYTVTVNSSEPGLLPRFVPDRLNSVRGCSFPDGATYVLPIGAITGIPSLIRQGRRHDHFVWHRFRVRYAQRSSRADRAGKQYAGAAISREYRGNSSDSHLCFVWLPAKWGCIS